MDTDPQKKSENVDVNSPDFYNGLQNEIETKLAKLKKAVARVAILRLKAAELELDTAILYHHELLYDVEELKNQAVDSSQQYITEQAHKTMNLN